MMMHVHIMFVLIQSLCVTRNESTANKNNAALVQLLLMHHLPAMHLFFKHISTFPVYSLVISQSPCIGSASHPHTTPWLLKIPIHAYVIIATLRHYMYDMTQFRDDTRNGSYNTKRMVMMIISALIATFFSLLQMLQQQQWVVMR